MQNSSGDESVISSNVASGASHGSSSSGVRSRTLRRRTSQSTSRVRRTSNLSSASGVRRTSNLSSASRVKRTSNVSSSDDEGFDHSYPSARALQTRKSLRKISFTEENEELERRPSSRRISSKGSLEKSMSQLSIESALSADPGIAFLDDPPEQMTRGRKIALKLMDKKWYNPLVDEDKTASVKEADPECANVDTCDGPNLQKAWAYFEHVTLSRYVVERHNVDVDKWGMFAKFIHSFKNYDEEMDLAQPGEKNRPSKLYDPITTPHRQVSVFLGGMESIGELPNILGSFCKKNLLNQLAFYSTWIAGRLWIGIRTLFQCKYMQTDSFWTSSITFWRKIFTHYPCRP